MIKKITLLLVCLFTVSMAFSQITPKPIAHPDKAAEQSAPDSGPYMEFESLTLDYGTIDQHSEPLRFLSFTNNGDEPLVITNAKGSCGCTVPVWPKEPIMPGETSKIEIRYATNRVGPFTKTVKFTTNETANAPQHVIKVTGKVNKVEEQETVPTSEPNMLSPGGE